MREAYLEFGIRVFRSRVDAFTGRLFKLVSNVSEKEVHETRIESRRMRVALRSFRPMFPPHPFNSVYKAVHRMTRILGGPRETAVCLGLVKELARNEAAGISCLEYLKERLTAKLRKQEARLEKKLKHIDPLRYRAKLDFLLSVMEPGKGEAALQESRPVESGPHAKGSFQPTLFPMRETALVQSCRMLERFTSSISGYPTTQRFNTATDEELHTLRIAAKKARYIMELYSPIWSGGLAAIIAKARKFQDAAGMFNDWQGLRCYIDREIRRLHSRKSIRLAFELGRLAEYVELRKSDLKSTMRIALIEFQEGLVDLNRKAQMLAENPDLSPTDLIPVGMRIKGRSRSKKSAGNSPAGIDAA
jgi:CHAD domain-containing protein